MSSGTAPTQGPGQPRGVGLSLSAPSARSWGASRPRRPTPAPFTRLPRLLPGQEGPGQRHPAGSGAQTGCTRGHGPAPGLHRAPLLLDHVGKTPEDAPLLRLLVSSTLWTCFLSSAAGDLLEGTQEASSLRATSLRVLGGCPLLGSFLGLLWDGLAAQMHPRRLREGGGLWEKQAGMDSGPA